MGSDRYVDTRSCSTQHAALSVGQKQHFVREGAVGKISRSFGATTSFGLNPRTQHRKEVKTENLFAVRNANVALRKMPTTDVIEKMVQQEVSLGMGSRGLTDMYKNASRVKDFRRQEQIAAVVQMQS